MDIQLSKNKINIGTLYINIPVEHPILFPSPAGNCIDFRHA